MIYDHETPFTFDVLTGTRSIKVEFNRPQQVFDQDRKQAESLYQWLTGGQNGIGARDTDIYGIVAFDPQMDIVKSFDEMALLDDFTSEDPKKVKAAKEKLAARKKEASEKIKHARERVVSLAEARIRRAIRFNHNNLIKQWQVNEENKMGKYAPSISEMLGSHALIAEIEASEAKGAELKKRASKLMNNPVI